MNGSQETSHLLHGVRHEHGLEVVTILEAGADAGSDGVDVLQYGGVLDTDDIVGSLGLDEVAGEDIGEGTGFLYVGTSDGQVTQSLKRHFFSMAGTSQTGKVLMGNVEHLVEILRADKVLVGHDAFDGGDDELVLDACLEFFQVILQIGGRGYEHQRVILLGNMVDVVLEVYLRGIEVYAGQIAGVVPHTAEILYLVVAAHIPANVVRVLHHNLGNGRRPRASADYGNATTKPTQALPKGGV